jgi:hypothetical protein
MPKATLGSSARAEAGPSKPKETKMGRMGRKTLRIGFVSPADGGDPANGVPIAFLMQNMELRKGG